MATELERITALEVKTQNVEDALERIEGKLDQVLQNGGKGSKGMIVLTLMNAALMITTIGVVAAIVYSHYH